MRTTNVRLRSPNNAPLQRIVLATVAVAAILLGLVAMHAMNAAPSGHAMASHASVDLSTSAHHGVGTAEHALPAQTAPIGVASPRGANGLDADGCMIFGMLCALGILAVVVTLALIHREPRNRIFDAVRRKIDAAAQGLAIPRPPSLLVLSISRT